VVLHMRCARLLGHSGADPDAVYRGREELEAAAELDPVLNGARMLLEQGVLDGSGLRALDAEIRARVLDSARRAVARPKLRSAADVMAPLAVDDVAAVRQEATRLPSDADRARAHGDGEALRLPEAQGPQPMVRLINWALSEQMARHPQSLLFGEDVAEKGGVYNVTSGLWKRYGAGRVFNTLLDETTILGLAQGAAFVGLLPVPEIQYLAFLHNAEDQLRGEAASTGFFSRGQLRAPMVLRIASFGYQKGFGGHFHNDDSIAVLRDIPGLRIATPSNGPDAVRLLRTLFASAVTEGRVTVFLEPIALYGQRDLYAEGDGLLAGTYPAPGEIILPGEVGVYGEGGDLTIATYANGVRMARRAARALEREHGVRARVLDLRWLAPLPVDAVVQHARQTGRLLVLDECRRAGNVGEALVAEVALQAPGVALGLVTARDSFVPLGDAAELVLPSEAEVVEAGLSLSRS
jgi:2-oxoisovalerate dehydrogenase E1 component